MTVVVYATNPNQTDLPAHPGNETYNNLTGVEKEWPMIPLHSEGPCIPEQKQHFHVQVRLYGEALKGVALPGEQKGTPRNSN